MKNNKQKNRGFAFGGTLVAWALGISAFFGGSTYIANETLNNNDLNKRVQNNREMNEMDHSFVPDHSILNIIDKGDVSDIEEEGLINMREEEKLARDVYRSLYEIWGLKVFQNISYSENRHSLSVKELLDRYSISDPVIDDTTGVFVLPAMQILYDELVEQGSISVTEALKVGVMIEDLDIYDLQQWMEKTDNKDITTVYENLIRGSRNHMRSFTKQLESHGEIYTAQFLDQDEIDKILISAQEHGSKSENSSMENNKGKGKGEGSRQGFNFQKL